MAMRGVRTLAGLDFLVIQVMLIIQMLVLKQIGDQLLFVLLVIMVLMMIVMDLLIIQQMVGVLV